MISKFLAGGALAFAAMVAVMLVTLGSPANEAEAAVNGISVAPSTIAVTGTATATIDVDTAGAGPLVAATHEVNILVSTGTITSVACTDAQAAPVTTVHPAAASCSAALTAGGTILGAPPLSVTSLWVGPNALGILINSLDTINATIAPPAVGPATIAVTAIQGTSVKTASIKVTGTASEVTVSIVTGVSAAAVTEGNGIAYNVVPGVGTTVLAAGGGALPAGQIVGNVADSAGTVLVGLSGVITTTAGTVTNPAQISNSKGNVGLAGGVLGAACAIATSSCLTAGTTGVAGAEATVTVSTGGKSGTTTAKFGGNPSTCTIVGDPSTTTPGTTSLLTATFADGTSGPIPDGVGIAFATVNAVTGSLAIVGTSTSFEGAATTNLLLGAPGGVAVAAAIATASIPPGGTFASLSCQNSIIVSGQTAPPTNGGGTGDGAIVGTLPSSGFGLVTFGGSVDELKTALATSCASGAPIFATSGGAFVGFFPTTSIVAVNAAFNALYSGGIPASTPLLGGNC